jgi:maleylacetoacetate isomerase
MKLYTYFRSSAAYRVRIALALKGIAYDPAYVHLIKDGGQHRAAAYKAVNPQGLVPALEDKGATIVQSMAMLEYLEETHPAVPLLPKDPVARAAVRGFALVLVADTHPLNNLRVLNYLKGPLGAAQADIDDWTRTWITAGFDACEALLPASSDGPFCFGAAPTFADVCLVPQVFSAKRFAVDMTRYPRLAAIDAHCRTLEAFAGAAPDRQPDAG